MDNGEGLPQYIKDHPIYYAGRPKRRKVMPPVLLAQRPPDDGFLCRSTASAGRKYDHAGEGNRSQQVTDACKKHGGFYLGVSVVRQLYWRREVLRAWNV